MREQDQVGESSEPMGPEAVPSMPGRQSPKSRERPDRESLLVDFAWLIIEAAVVFRRLRGILARL
jgi:hypothetical protein